MPQREKVQSKSCGERDSVVAESAKFSGKIGGNSAKPEMT